MNILAVGDLVGEGAVEKLKQNLAKLKEDNKIDFVIVNAENSAGGMGISTKIFNQLKALKIDCITMGNHTWGKMDIFTFIDDDILLRPANYTKGIVGKGYNIYNVNNKKICVINLIGRTDMGVLSDNPFTVIDEILVEVKDKVDFIIIDFHAEATAEKIAMKYYLDGKVSLIFGTHTHVQTADEHVTQNGTAFITDIGMTGPVKSVIGMDVNASVKRFVTTLPERYKLATGECFLNGIVVKIDDKTGKALEIKRINIK